MRLSAHHPGRLSRRAALLGLAGAPLFTGAVPAVPQKTASQPPPVPPLPAPVLRALKASGLPLQSFGLFIRPVNSPEPVAALNADQAYMLASTTKLVTSLAALDILGPRYRWRTQAFATADVENGTLRGDLIIVGGGDPSLSTADLRDWMQRIRARGLQDVRGDIILDRSVFRLHDEDHASTPEPAPDRPHHVRPDALTLDQGVLRLSVQPMRRGVAAVQQVSNLAGVRLVNKVSAGDGCTAQARWEPSNGQPQLWVEGHWDTTCGQGQLAVVPPTDARVFNRAVASMWKEVGGRLKGQVREGSLRSLQRDGIRLPLYRPDGEPIFPWATHLSRPLPEVIRDINKTSNNLAARHLMLSLSPGFPVQAATLPSAQAAVRKWLHQQGLAAGDIEVDNGSGLSRAERGKPRAMVHLLCNAWLSRQARSFFDSLPVAGVDGTLAHRMERGYATGQAFLKTGSLLDTRALAGYVRGQSGMVYAMAALLNHPDAAVGRPALDAVIEWLARSG